MAQYKAQIMFPPKGKMDSDSDWRSMAQGDIIDALNCRWGVRNDNSVGAVENVSGNVLLPINLPEGNNKVIGACCDYPNNRVIIFNFNDKNNHGVFEINMITREITPILWIEPTLAFSEDGFIMNATVIDGEVYFLDTNGRPRNIIIESAVKYTYAKWPQGVGYWLVEEYIVQP